jgi:hypothetical protein
MPVSTSSDISVKQWNNGTPLKIDQFTGIAPFHIQEVSHIEPIRISEIAPAAIHIKEVNKIDPLIIDSLHVSEVKNIDPINIEHFNVTHLPTVNLSVRQIPAVDMNIRRLPPVSVGFHQDIHVPSNYTVRARLFGIEFFRMNMSGHTMLVPKDKVRRELSKTHEKSFPETAVAGNPAIPSKHTEKISVVVSPQLHCYSHTHETDRNTYHGVHAHETDFSHEEEYRMPVSQTDQDDSFRVGFPQASFSIHDSQQPSSTTRSLSGGGV